MTRPYEIIWENEELLLLNKASGISSIPDRRQGPPSLKEIAEPRQGHLFTLHRLDRETSGLILFARTAAAHQFMSLAFEGRQVDKFYLGFVQGPLRRKSGQVEAPIAEHPAGNGKMVLHARGKPSVTAYEVLEEFGLYSLVRFQLLTGRTHQIRIHMQSIGNPLVCDPLYGDGQPVYLSGFKKHFKLSRSETAERPMLQRLALHAERLHFTDPSGLVQDHQAPLPRDMQALWKQLRKWKA
jgi:23S rRNA pseudouridine1911/1915/1917 synthase